MVIEAGLRAAAPRLVPLLRLAQSPESPVQVQLRMAGICPTYGTELLVEVGSHSVEFEERVLQPEA
jgi:hypothetical protein